MKYWDFYIQGTGRVLIPPAMVRRIMIVENTIVYETPRTTYVANYEPNMVLDFMTNEPAVKSADDLLQMDYEAILEGQHPKYAREVTILEPGPTPAE